MKNRIIKALLQEENLLVLDLANITDAFKEFHKEETHSLDQGYGN